MHTSEKENSAKNVFIDKEGTIYFSINCISIRSDGNRKEGRIFYILIIVNDISLLRASFPITLRRHTVRNMTTVLAFIYL